MEIDIQENLIMEQKYKFEGWERVKRKTNYLEEFARGTR